MNGLTRNPRSNVDDAARGPYDFCDAPLYTLGGKYSCGFAHIRERRVHPWRSMDWLRRRMSTTTFTVAGMSCCADRCESLVRVICRSRPRTRALDGALSVPYGQLPVGALPRAIGVAGERGGGDSNSRGHLGRNALITRTRGLS